MGTGAPTARSKHDYAVKLRLDLIAGYYDLGGKRVLDVGCGNGVYTVEIAKIARFVLGVDLNEKFIEEAMKVREREGVQNVKFECCSIEEFEYKEKFDVAIMMEVLEHVTDEEEVLFKIKELLSENGYLILFVPNKLYPFETHGIRVMGKNIHFKGSFPLFSWLPEFIRRRFVEERIYTVKRLKELLKKCEFEPLAFDYMPPPLDLLPKKIANPARKFLSVLSKTPLRIFGMSIFCLAVKKNG